MINSLTKCAVVAVAFSALTVPAHAKGCIKGALIGGAVGHYIGHHGGIGAVAGCAIGHHEANKPDQAQQRAPRQSPLQQNSSQ
jgi:uncharacterized protein YcfJ